MCPWSIRHLTVVALIRRCLELREIQVGYHDSTSRLSICFWENCFEASTNLSLWRDMKSDLAGYYKSATIECSI
eukprot:gene7872-16114_t